MPRIAELTGPFLRRHPNAGVSILSRSSDEIRDQSEALVGYLLQQWRVDCSPDARLDPHSHPLRLANPELVATLTNCRLLPGVAP